MKLQVVRTSIVIRVLALLGSMLILASPGCAKPTPEPSSTPLTTSSSVSTVSTSAPPSTKVSTQTPAPKPVSEGPSGRLRIGVNSFNIESFDPVRQNLGSVPTLGAPMYDFLIDMDQQEKVNTGVAEIWQIDSGGLSWTFRIRKGIKFHNGDDLKATDVKFSLERYTLPIAYYVNLRNSQDRVEVVDDYTVRVFTKGVQPFYYRFVGSRMANQGLIMPKAYFEKVGVDNFTSNPVGTGPFKFVRHVQGDVVEYEAVNQHYRRVPAFRNLSVINIPEEATRIAMLKVGELDVGAIGQLSSVPGLEAAGLRVAPLAGYQYYVNLWGAYDPRTKGLPIADVRVREALSLAINRDEVSRTIFYGKLSPLMPPLMGPDQPEIDVPYWGAQSAKYFGYDPARARQLLTAAGYPQGFNIKLAYWGATGNDYASVLAEITQAYWAKIGVKADLVPTSSTVMIAKRRSGPNRGPADDWLGQASVMSSNAKEVPAQAFVSFFTPDGSMDWTSSAIGQNAELANLIKNALVELDQAKRFDMTAKAIQLTMDTRVVAVIGTAPSTAAMGPLVDIDLPSGALGIPMYAEIAKHRKK